ncbi:MAG: MarR family transcriptional regulator [Acutalibacteraceae bacterium]|nr:MarR family transcriptional regulator [Acutalibacteraceae bacterium]
MSTTEEKILIGVSRLRNLMFREMETHFREYGLTSAQFSVLEALYSKGQLTVGEIQEAILGTPGNVPVIVNNLVKAGYVTKNRDEKDRRVSRITLSKEGKDLMESMYPQPHQSWLEEILAPLTKEERKELAAMLIKSYQSIRRVQRS